MTYRMHSQKVLSEEKTYVRVFVKNPEGKLLLLKNSYVHPSMQWTVPDGFVRNEDMIKSSVVHFASSLLREHVVVKILNIKPLELSVNAPTKTLSFIVNTKNDDVVLVDRGPETYQEYAWITSDELRFKVTDLFLSQYELDKIFIAK